MRHFEGEILVVNLIDKRSKIFQMNFHNFYKFGPFHTFLTITEFNIPLKVPHLLALGHIRCQDILNVFDSRICERLLISGHNNIVLGSHQKKTKI